MNFRALGKALATTLQASHATETVAPSLCFVEFCEQLGVALHPGQKVVAKVAYDRVPVSELPEEEQGIARRVFGSLPAAFDLGCFATIGLVCGGRAGKSYVLIALRLLWGALTRDLKSVAPGQQAVALVLAPNDTLRREAVNYAKGAALKSPWRSWVKLPSGSSEVGSASYFDLVRPDKKVVRFEGGVATKGGYGGRGRSLTDFAMDEAAFFRSADFAVSDTEVFRAAAARVLPGGQSIVASTPWAKSGLLYDMYATNFGSPKDALVAKAPTLVLHDSELTRSLVTRELKRDPDNARREFEAEFVAFDDALFFAAELLKTSEDMGPPRPGERVAIGVDLGFRSDSSALVIACHGPGYVRVLPPLELRPEPGKPLVPSEVCERFAAEAKAAGASFVIADGHYRDTLAEALRDANLVCSPAPVKPAEAFVKTRVMMREGKILLPNHERLLRQLKEVKSSAQPAGGLSISQPRNGGHGDLVSAMVLALWFEWGSEIASEIPRAEQERLRRKQRFIDLETKKERNPWAF